MMDPTRIPGVLDAVRRTWEGQPDLSLPTLFCLLGNRGVGWGSTDEDLVAALAELEHIHPGQLPRVDARVTARWLLLTDSPAHRVTVDPWRVVTRRITPGGAAGQPGVWEYHAIRPAAPGRPLVITDADGIDHRLGVVTGITLLDHAPVAEVADLSGLRRRDVDDAVHLIRLADGGSVLLDHGLELFIPGRRHLERQAGKWEQLLTCRPGEDLTLTRPGGGNPEHLGTVGSILRVEDAPADQSSTGSRWMR